MRIISQDGFYDVPYEFITIECVNLQVFARPVAGRDSGSICELATYKTREKAKKALEMLRERYSNSDLCKDDIQFRAETMVGDANSAIAKFMVDITYFRLPQDSEVEV